jgi:hypothetical protein
VRPVCPPLVLIQNVSVRSTPLPPNCLSKISGFSKIEIRFICCHGNILTSEVTKEERTIKEKLKTVDVRRLIGEK